MNKHIVIYPYNRTLFKHKKEWSADTCYNTDESQKYYVKWKNPGTWVTCMILFILNIQKYLNP